MAEKNSIETISEIVINNGTVFPDNQTVLESVKPFGRNTNQNEKEFNDLKKVLFIFLFLLCFLVFSFFYAQFFLYRL